MNKVLNHNFFSGYSTIEWRVIKICFCLYWWPQITSSVINYSLIPYPTGIASYIDLSFLLSKHTSLIFSTAGFLLAVLYIMEKWMRVTTFLMFALSLVVFTLEDSNGVLNRTSLYTMIFFVQWIAYVKNSSNLSSERVQYAIQIIAAGYLLAALSKLNQSGLGWVSSAPMASLQILKNFAYTYFDSGNINEMNTGIKQASFILNHATIGKILFGFSLLTELFAWVAIKNKFRALAYGLLLTGMHIGIFCFMNILISSIFYPMLIFMVNPGYWLYLIYARYSRASI